jgi:predicted RNase H-related nuclease YkuK (DUF458 family)
VQGSGEYLSPGCCSVEEKEVTMDKIVLKHSRIEINNYESGDCPQIEYIFSIWDPVYHISRPKAIEYDEENKKLILPRGIDVSYVINMFLEEPYVDKNCDEYVNTPPLAIKYLTRDDRQMEILKFLIGRDKYSFTRSKSQLSVNSTTGSGKTFITVAAVCYTGARCILITSSIDWLQQWKEKILEYTNLSEDQIYMITGAASINKLMARDNVLDYQFFLASHSTIRSYGDKNGWTKVDDLFRFLKCSVKVFDEAHLYFDNMSKIDFHSNCKKTIYLTATPARSAKDENTIYQLYFKNIPSISLFDEELDPHVNYFAIHYSSHPKPNDLSNCINQYGFDRNKYIAYVVKRPYFLKMVTLIMDVVWNMTGKVLIYVGTNAGIMVVYEHIISEFPFMDGYVGIYTSLTNNQPNKEDNLKKKIILSTTKSCGAASDIADLMVTINLAEPFKSEVLTRQTLGRCRAWNSLFIDLVDEGFVFTKRYYKTKRPIYLQYAKSCKDVYMEDEEIDQRTDAVHEKYSSLKVMCGTVYTR